MFNHWLAVCSWILSVPLSIVGLECLASLDPRRRRSPGAALNLRCVVLVPAHNEAAGIGQVLQPLRQQLGPADTLIVVADNCTDDTASIAKAAGATVYERHDPKKRGKGYALDFAIKKLKDNPPDIVIIVDADCHIQPGSLTKLAHVAALTGRPAQALYSFSAPHNPSYRDRLSAFAVQVRNVVRPIGASRLGLSCCLQGSGMAFPWRVIESAPLASANLVEDLQLGIDLTLRGTPPVLVEDAKIIGQLPAQEAGKSSQRTRWEHGHLSTMLQQLPRILWIALRKRRLDLLALGLDLAVPPLSLLTILLFCFWCCALPYLVLAGHEAQLVSVLTPITIATGLYLIGILSAAWRHGQGVITLGELVGVPLYLAWKLPIYLKFLRKREQQWIRTARDQSN